MGLILRRPPRRVLVKEFDHDTKERVATMSPVFAAPYGIKVHRRRTGKAGKIAALTLGTAIAAALALWWLW
jgi:hypothetical protein